MNNYEKNQEGIARVGSLYSLVSQLNRRHQSLDEHQAECLETCMGTCQNIAYPTMGLCEEVAEYVQKLLEVISWNPDFVHTKYESPLYQAMYDFACAGLCIGQIAKQLRHGSIPRPFDLDPYKADADHIGALHAELADIDWELNAASFFLTDPGHLPVLNAQLRADFLHTKLSSRQKSHTIDGQGDADRTPISQPPSQL